MDTYEELYRELFSAPVPRERLMFRSLLQAPTAEEDRGNRDTYAELLRQLDSIPFLWLR